MNQNCNACFSYSATDCESPINFPSGLAPLTNLYLLVVDKFSHQYRDVIVVQNDSSIDIDTTQFPEGLFNAYAGSLEVSLSTDQAGNDLVQFKPNTLNPSKLYDCLLLTISTTAASFNTAVVNGCQPNIQCPAGTTGTHKLILSLETITNPIKFQYLLYGDLTIQGRLINNEDVTLLNGALVLQGNGTFFNSGNLNLINLKTLP
jgi:hypothetical protein